MSLVVKDGEVCWPITLHLVTRYKNILSEKISGI